MAYPLRAYFLLLALPAAAQNWPMYLGDAAHSSFNGAESELSRENVAQLQPSWSIHVGAPMAAAPSVVDGILYFGDWKGNFYAVDGAGGHILWSQFVGMAVAPDNPVCQPAIGVSGQAAVVDDTVYVPGGDAAVYALDRESGRIVWRVPLADPATGAYLWSSITPRDGSLYLGIASLGDCPLVRGALVRIRLDDPHHPQIAYLAPAEDVGGGVWSTPALDEAGNSVVITTGTGEQDVEEGMWGGTLATLDIETLQLKDWFFLPSNSVEEDIEWGSSPTVFTHSDGTRAVAASGKDGVLYALTADGMQPLWETKLATGCICPECGCGALSTPAWDGARLYAGAGTADPNSFYSGSVYALEADGAPVWRYDTEGVVIAPVTIANGLVYVPTTLGLLVLDAETGELLWDDEGRGPLYSQAVVLDGTVYSTYVTGEVVAWRVP